MGRQALPRVHVVQAPLRPGIQGRYASPNLMLQLMRNEFRVSVPNAYAAPLARIAMEQDSSIRFRLARSKVDGWTEAVL